jgi:hypothetical protein
MKPTSFWRVTAGAGGQLREQGRDCVEGVHMLCLGQAVAERVMAHINDSLNVPRTVKLWPAEARLWARSHAWAHALARRARTSSSVAGARWYCGCPALGLVWTRVAVR